MLNEEYYQKLKEIEAETLEYISEGVRCPSIGRIFWLYSPQTWRQTMAGR